MKKKIINSSETFFSNENDKIMFLIEHVFEAKNLETAITMEQIVEKGIEMNLCETYPRGKADGHPWYPHTSTMCGIHKEGTGNKNYEPYLHRAFIKRPETKRKVFVYWIDKSKVAPVVTRNQKEVTRQAKVVERTPVIIRETKGQFTPEQMDQKVKENPGMFIILNNRLYLREFVINHPEKFGLAAQVLANL